MVSFLGVGKSVSKGLIFPLQSCFSKTPTSFGYLLQHKRFFSSASLYDTDWTPTKDYLNYDEFYKTHLQEKLEECYLAMGKPPLPWEKSYFIKSEHLVSAAIRYPSLFSSHFKQEVIDSRIVVEDPTITYPSWVKGNPLILRQPIQILVPTFPPRHFHCLYTDGSPNGKDSGHGGGGMVLVNDEGHLRAFRVAVDHYGPLETEASVFLAGAKHLLSRGIKKCIFKSDSTELIEGLKGRRYIRESCYPLFREINLVLSHFEEKVFHYIPREGVAACDAIANDMKRQINRVARNKFRSWYNVGEVYELAYDHESPEISDLLKKVEKRVPRLRLEPFGDHQLKGKTYEEINKMMRFCPEKELPSQF